MGFKTSDLLLLGVGGYLFLRNTPAVGAVLDYSKYAMPATQILSPAYTATKYIQTGFETHGGLLGENSATQKIQEIISSPVPAVAVGGATINAVQNLQQTIKTGFETHGGILGEKSLTDIGYHFQNIFGGIRLW